jgi:hypothetical protein
MRSFKLDDSTICFVNLVAEQNSVQELSYPLDAVLILDGGMRASCDGRDKEEPEQFEKKEK